MMKRSNIMLIGMCAAMLAFAAGDARAQGAAAPAVQKNALAPVEFLVGTWQADGQTPGMGKFTIYRQYQPLFGGSFIEMREVMRGEKRNVNTRAIIGVDPLTGKLTGWSFADDGSMTEIVLMDAPAADGVVFEGKFVAGAAPNPIRSSIKKTAAGFDEIIQTQRGGQWTNFTTMKFAKAAGEQDFSGGISGLPPPDSPLAPLSKFAGAWLIEGENDGQKFVVEYAFQWALGGRFMTTTYSVGMGGAPQLHAMSMIGYDPSAKALIQRGFNTEGSVLRARVSVAGDTLTWEGQMAGAESRGLRSTYRLTDPDTLEFTTEVKKGDTWESLGTAPMRRHKH